MRSGPAVTVIVEPNLGGHRFQWVAWVAAVALDRGDEVILLTVHGGGTSEPYTTFLHHLPLTVVECFDEAEPPIADIGQALVDLHRERGMSTYVMLDADRMLKTWWRAAPKELRSGLDHPTAILAMTRYPPRLLWTDRKLLTLRLAKTAVSALARLTGAATRISYVTGRDDLSAGWLVKKARDPAICLSHSRDRATLRQRFDLPGERHLLGILGYISMRKNLPMVLEAALLAGPDVDMLLAGNIDDEVADWLAALGPEERPRVHDRIGFLPDEELDAYVALSDVVVVAQSNPGPSGIMGKAMVAEVPVLSAASSVRKREASSLGIGIHTELTPEAMAEGVRSLRGRPAGGGGAAIPMPTAEEFGSVILGLRDNGAAAPAVSARRGSRPGGARP